MKRDHLVQPGRTISRAFRAISPKVRGRRRPSLVILLGLLVAISLGIAMCERAEEKVQFQLRTEIPSSGDAFALAFYQSLGARLQAGHEVSVVGNGAVFERIAEDVRAAKLHVHFDVFIWQKGRASDLLIDALAARAKGVECRVLVDDIGSPGFEDDIAPHLARVGCEWRIFRRIPGAGDKLARNHRKIVVVDGRIAFTGGFGIRDEWLGDGVTNEAWRDANVRFVGPAVLDAQQAIAENWQEAGGALFPQSAFPFLRDDDERDPDFDPLGPATAAFVSSTASPVLSRAERLVQVMIRAAKKRLWIANAYFVPSDEILELVKEKASSGVDVRLLLAGKKSDSRISMGSQHVAYGPLTRNHVRIFEYAPSMMHAKTFVVDDELSVVGSINLEPLSFSKLEEGALVVVDRAFNEEMAKVFEDDCKHATEIER